MGDTYTALIDTGSTNTYINNEIYEKCRQKAPVEINRTRNIILADGTHVKINKTITVHITIKDVSFKHCLRVLPQASSVIIGMDILNRLGCQLTFLNTPCPINKTVKKNEEPVKQKQQIKTPKKNNNLVPLNNLQNTVPSHRKKYPEKPQLPVNMPLTEQGCTPNNTAMSTPPGGKEKKLVKIEPKPEQKVTFNNINKRKLRNCTQEKDYFSELNTAIDTAIQQATAKFRTATYQNIEIPNPITAPTNEPVKNTKLPVPNLLNKSKTENYLKHKNLGVIPPTKGKFTYDNNNLKYNKKEYKYEQTITEIKKGKNI